MSAALAMMGAGEHLSSGEERSGDGRGEQAIGRKGAHNAKVTREKICSADLAPRSAETAVWRGERFGGSGGRRAPKSADDFDGLVELGGFVEKVLSAQFQAF